MMPNPTPNPNTVHALYFGHMYCMDSRENIDQYQLAVILGK